MQLETLKSLVETAIARQTDIELLLASERLLILPISTKALHTGELEIAASDPSLRNLPDREGHFQKPFTPHTRTWTFVPSSVHAACIREIPKP